MRLINNGKNNEKGYPMTQTELASKMDHTLLKAVATPEQVEQLCREAIQIGAASVCINPCFVRQAAALLAGTRVSVCTVVGFPLGATTSAVKAFETKEAISNGAKEIDMVIPIGALKAGRDEQVLEDIHAVVGAADGALVKVIIETCFLTDDEKARACALAMEAGADYVKTSTGFGMGGATVHDVALMKAVVGTRLRVKASGGIRTLGDALSLIEAGADRLGVSASLSILEEMAQTL